MRLLSRWSRCLLSALEAAGPALDDVVRCVGSLDAGKVEAERVSVQCGEGDDDACRSVVKEKTDRLMSK